jgi:hypothetical protein
MATFLTASVSRIFPKYGPRLYDLFTNPAFAAGGAAMEATSAAVRHRARTRMKKAPARCAEALVSGCPPDGRATDQ